MTPTGLLLTDSAPRTRLQKEIPPHRAPYKASSVVLLLAASYPDAMPQPAARFPESLGDLGAHVELRIEALLTSEHVRWSAVDPTLGDPIDALRALVLAGGKRLRPAFAAAGLVAAGGSTESPNLIDAGAALELLHTFALVHDDVMDGSRIRRNMPAVHARFECAHAANEWRGETRRFGEGIAILVGDFAFVYADTLLRRASPKTLALWDELRLELCVGQSLDLLGAAHRNTDIDFAHRIARYKSAKYTVERPLHLGAALADRLDDLRTPLSAIGLPLGTAFQLRDDLLGVFGDEAATGKPVGDDFREGKPTPLVAIASANADAEGHRQLGRIGAADLDDVEIKQLQELLVTTGAVRGIEREISDLVDEASLAIESAPIPDTAKELLNELAAYCAWRDH